jgi:uncharacterized protein YycO
MIATLQRGDFGLTQIGGPTGQIIRGLQWLDGTGFANFEHAFIYTGNGQIIEAEPGGARVGNVNEYSDIYWSSGHFDLTESQRSAICSAAVHYVGTPYSFLDYASLVARRLRLPVPGLKHYVADTGHMICSQLVAACYDVSGCPLFGDEWTGWVTPGDLYELIR